MLNDVIKLYKFLRECDQFEMWARETETALVDSAASNNVQASRKKFNVCSEKNSPT